MSALENELKQYNEEFTKITKKIIKKQLTTNQVKLDQYRNELIDYFNKYSKYAGSIWHKLSKNEATLVRSQFIYFRDRALIAFGFLKLQIKVPKEIGQIIDVIVEEEEEEIDIENEIKEDNKMPLSAVEFIKLAVGLVPNYDGNPSGLQKFLDSIDLLNTLADGNEAQVLPFVKTRLEQRARNVIPVNTASITELKNALKQNIKPVDSEVIKAKIAALKVDRMPINDFSAKAEELAEEFQHALILETGNSENARIQTQKELVKLCRANARTDLTRSVIASTTFTSPKEVLAKFVTEIAEEKTEKSLLYINKYGYRNRGRGAQHFNRYSENRYRNGDGFGHTEYANRGNYRGRRRISNNINSRGRNFHPNRAIRYASTTEQENGDFPQPARLGVQSEARTRARIQTYTERDSS